MKPYRPSNGSEGCAFMAHWCERCTRDAKYQRTQRAEDGCRIAAAAFAGYVEEWVEDDDGPRCTAFRLPTPCKRKPSTDKRQKALFEVK